MKNGVNWEWNFFFGMTDDACRNINIKDAPSITFSLLMNILWDADMNCQESRYLWS